MIGLTTYDEGVRYFNAHQIVSIGNWIGAQREFQGMTMVYCNGDYVLVREPLAVVRARIEDAR
jgi:hypothetical protein